MQAEPTRCASCGTPLPRSVSRCSACGAPAVEEPPPVEPVPGPVSYAQAAPRWLGAPAALVLLCVGFAALGAAVGLFAAGHWPLGLVLLGVAVVVLAGVAEVSRHRPLPGVAVRGGALARDRQAEVDAAARVWRARLELQLARGRTAWRVRELARQRRPALEALGDAVWRGDAAAEERARAQLAELEEQRLRHERSLAEHRDEAGRRIREARFPVQETMMVAPNEPSPPYPPPGEADPPQPATVPEPYPPPDEGTPPTPAPDPGEPPRER